MTVQNLVVVRPVAVTPAMLVSTDVPEDDYDEWLVGSTYDEGDRVIVEAQHKVYQSMANSNTGVNPVGDATGKWAEVSVTNRWKSFDGSVSTQTAQADAISYRVHVGKATTSVAVLNLTGATSVRIRVVDPVYGTVYDRTISLSAIPVVVGWWQWYFGQRRTPTQALVQDLPSFPNADILLDFVGGSTLAVGVILLGQYRSFGEYVVKGARTGIQDYSRKEKTEFGDTVVVERAFAKRASFSLRMAAAEVDAFNSFMADVRAKPCLWLATDRYESTTVYGFYKFYDITIDYYDYSSAELEVEGLT